MAIEEEIDFDIDVSTIDAAIAATQLLGSAIKDAAKQAAAFSADKLSAAGQAAASVGAAAKAAWQGNTEAAAAMGEALKSLESDYKMLNDAARTSTDPETFIQLKAAADKTQAAIKKVKAEMQAIASESVGGKVKALAGKGLAGAWALSKKAAVGALKLTGKGLLAVGKTAVTSVGKLAVGAVKMTGKGLFSLGKLAAGAAVAGLAAVAAALHKIGTTVIARDNLRATLDQVTRGRGSEALKALEKLAKGLNLTIEEATEQFVALRDKGLSNVDASKLIKLRADLEAVGVSAEDAAKAVDATVDAIKAGKGVDKAIADTAKKYGAVGDGSNAAAKKAFTLEGQIKAAMIAIEQAIGKVADKLGPTILKIVKAFTGAFDNVDPEAFDKYLDAVQSSLEEVIPIAKAFGTGLAYVFSAVSASAGAMKGVISTVVAAVQVAAQYLAAAWQAHGPTVVAIFNAIAGAVQSMAGVIGGAISAALGILSSFSTAFQSAGGSLVDGFVAGLKAAVGKAVEAAKGLGKDAAAALKSSLGIASPSKVAAGYGQNFGQSFADSAEEHTPNLDTIVPTNGAPSGTATGGSKRYEITITIQGGNASAQEIGAEAEIAVENALRRVG